MNTSGNGSTTGGKSSFRGLNNNRLLKKGSLSPSLDFFQYPNQDTFHHADDDLNHARAYFGFDERALENNVNISRDRNGRRTACGSFSASTHSSNNLFQLQRQSTQGITPSFSSSVNGHGYNDMTSHIADAEFNLSRFKVTQNAFGASNIELYPLPSLPGYGSQNESPTPWKRGLDSFSKDLSKYPRRHTEHAFVDAASFTDRDFTVPTENYCRPCNPDSYQLNDSGKSNSAHSQALGRQSVHGLYNYPPPKNPYLNSYQFGYLPVTPNRSATIVPQGPKHYDERLGVCNSLLKEFHRNPKSNSLYTLKDIYNHVVEFSSDQYGSLFIQQKLQTASSAEMDQVFREIQPNALRLMTDVFGNFVVQKLFEHGKQVQKRLLAEQMKDHVHQLSVHKYGSRVVQKALERVLADQQAELVTELRRDILLCMKNMYGNHVVQKVIERVPAKDIRFIINASKGQVQTLATHPYGCRVIQTMLERFSAEDQVEIVEELHACAEMLIIDQNGNYVMQQVIVHGKPEDRAKIIKIVTAQLFALSTHKFASNVVEKTIQFGSDEQRRAMAAQLTAPHSDGRCPLQLIIKDTYGYYVVRTLLGNFEGVEHERFLEVIKSQTG